MDLEYPEMQMVTGYTSFSGASCMAETANGRILESREIPGQQEILFRNRLLIGLLLLRAVNGGKPVLHDSSLS